MKLEMIDKLSRELKKEMSEECRVVYILSRIRKVLELENSKNKYKVLNFYCNWSLHAKIDNTKPVREFIKSFIINKVVNTLKVLYT